MTRTPSWVFQIAILLSLTVVATASATPGKKINKVHGSGTNPVVVVSATAKKPSELRIGVENDPAGVKVSYTVICANSGKVKSRSANYTTDNTSDIRKLGLPIKKPSSCQLTATVRFATPPNPATGSFVATLYARKQK